MYRRIRARMEHNLARIASDNKQPGSQSNSDFIVGFNNNHCCESVTRTIVKSATIPNVFYNINDSGYNLLDTGNNAFTYKIAGSPTTVTVSVGQYTITELLDALVTALAAVGFSYVVDAKTKRIAFTVTTAIQFLDSDENNMARTLGILTSSVGDVTTYTTTGFYNLAGVQEVYLVSSKISDGSNLILQEGVSEPVIAIIPMTVPFGEYEHFRAYSEELEQIDYPSYTQGCSVRQADLIIKNKFNHVLSLGGLDISVILKLYHNTNS